MFTVDLVMRRHLAQVKLIILPPGNCRWVWASFEHTTSNLGNSELATFCMLCGLGSQSMEKEKRQSRERQAERYSESSTVFQFLVVSFGALKLWLLDFMKYPCVYIVNLIPTVCLNYFFSLNYLELNSVACNHKPLTKNVHYI